MNSCSTFFQRLDSFDQLEELDLIQFYGPSPAVDSQLSLPKLKYFRADLLRGIGKLILDAPRLQNIYLCNCEELNLEMVRTESVEGIFTACFKWLDVEKFEKLKYLRCPGFISDTLLINLKQLKEIHLSCEESSRKVLAQKQRHRRSDLKIYNRGLLLRNFNDLKALPAKKSHLPSKELVNCYEQNYERLADELIYSSIDYSQIESIVSMTSIDLWKRFTYLNSIQVNKSIYPKTLNSFFSF